MADLDIPTPRWARPLLAPARYKGAHGGRGSGKSHMFAEMVIEAHLEDCNRSTVCVREVQKSLAQSVKRLLESKIQSMGVGSFFEVQEAVIKSSKGTGRIIFMGMQDHTAESIKSLEGYDCAWVEEAQSLSDHSLRLLRPTIRKPGSELWFTWNPSRPTDAVDKLLRGPSPPPGAIVVKADYLDNPWFPVDLQAEVDMDKARDPAVFEHVWMGGYDVGGEGRVYSRFDRRRHCGVPLVKPGQGVIEIACDFNVRYMHWLILEVDEDRKVGHVVAEVIKEGGTQTDLHAELTAGVIATYLSKIRGKTVTREDVFRMRIKAYIDSTNKRLTTTSSLSDVHLLLQAGFQPQFGGNNPPVKDRIKTVNALFRDGRLSIDQARAPMLVMNLETQSYDDNGEPDKRNNIDHGIDGLGYLCHWRWPVHAPKPNMAPVRSAGLDEWGPLG
jgi:PBSX family phage terminase large subunit